MIGLVAPGRSPLHRAAAGWKLAGLAVAVLVVALLPGWPWLLGAAGVTVLLFAVGGIPPRLAAAQVLPVLWLVLVAGVINWLIQGWEPALTMALRVLVCVALAALLTLTTQVSEILDAVQRGLRPFGSRVDADRVGLVLAMTIRAVPLMHEIVRAVLEARKARGAESSLRAVAVPVVVRALQTADAMGEALAARGVDD
ncbi:CbiQ family ECF transporter T component [Agromyces sp. G08B096]|uniref:CbiQ family ECF transporter T component n=1 Tax=Agromyces sp. G08B096 TaxID=3156399 RepID=A0AAU7WA12_9MICO